MTLLLSSLHRRFERFALPTRLMVEKVVYRDLPDTEETDAAGGRLKIVQGRIYFVKLLLGVKRSLVYCGLAHASTDDRLALHEGPTLKQRCDNMFC
jgi:hypothetical protein